MEDQLNFEQPTSLHFYARCKVHWLLIFYLLILGTSEIDKIHSHMLKSMTTQDGFTESLSVRFQSLLCLLSLLFFSHSPFIVGSFLSPFLIVAYQKLPGSHLISSTKSFADFWFGGVFKSPFSEFEGTWLILILSLVCRHTSEPVSFCSNALLLTACLGRQSLVIGASTKMVMW